MVLLAIALAELSGQNIPTYPIPSFGVTVDGYGNFCNSLPGLPDKSRGERQVHVIVRAQLGTPQTPVKVWVYTTDYVTILGPYSVLYGETLTVKIDDRDWAVFVETDQKVSVDVWIDE
jgi:hypothetical protein